MIVTKVCVKNGGLKPMPPDARHNVGGYSDFLGQTSQSE